MRCGLSRACAAICDVATAELASCRGSDEPSGDSQSVVRAGPVQAPSRRPHVTTAAPNLTYDPLIDRSTGQRKSAAPAGASLELVDEL